MDEEHKGESDQGDLLAGLPDISIDEQTKMVDVAVAHTGHEDEDYHKDKVLDEFKDYAHMMAKPRGFWSQPSSLEVVKAVAERHLTPEKGAELLSAEVWKVKDRAAKYRKHGESMGFGGAAKVPDENALVTVSYDQMSKNHIDWARFLELDKPEYFDLRRISAMCYASEAIITWKAPHGVKVPGEFQAMRFRAAEFVDKWAVYFGKYALAACLGEFRHRRTSGPVKLVPMGRGKIAREAAQSAAENLWPSKENTTKAAAWMADKFKDPSYFTGGGFGGPPWARIANTLFQWLSGKIPNIVWVDYVWDLSHNAGRFFDKCHLWQEEASNRVLLGRKRAIRSGDVRAWGKEYMHPDWASALDLIEIMSTPPEVG